MQAKDCLDILCVITADTVGIANRQKHIKKCLTGCLRSMWSDQVDTILVCCCFGNGVGQELISCFINLDDRLLDICHHLLDLLPQNASITWKLWRVYRLSKHCVFNSENFILLTTRKRMNKTTGKIEPFCTSLASLPNTSSQHFILAKR